MERITPSFLESARRTDRSLSNLLSIGDVVHVTQSRDVTLEHYVTITVPVPPPSGRAAGREGGEGGRLHVLTYAEDGSLTCVPCPYSHRVQRGFVVIRAWSLARSAGDNTK